AITSEERLKQALSRSEEARSYLLPRVDAQASQYRKKTNLESAGIIIPRTDSIVGPFSSFDARLLASVTLFDIESIRRFHQMKSGNALAQAEVDLTKQDAMVMGAALYLAARRAQVTLASARVTRDYSVQKAKTVAAQHDEGTASDIELKAA